MCTRTSNHLQVKISPEVIVFAASRRENAVLADVLVFPSYQRFSISLTTLANDQFYNSDAQRPKSVGNKSYETNRSRTGKL
jgi:hypothetical protein